MKKRLLAIFLCLTLALGLTSASAQTVRPNVTDLLFKYTELDLNPYKGKTVVLNFFTEWCFYCMQEMPDFEKIHGMYDPEALEVVMVHVWDGEDETSTKNVKEKFGMEDMTFFEDKDRMVASAVGLMGYPATIIVGPDGGLVQAVNSMVTLEWLTAVLDDMGTARAEESDESV